MTNTPQQNDLANAIRSLSMDAVEKANSGHPGLPMGCADIATVLFTKVMKFDPADSKWSSPIGLPGLSLMHGRLRGHVWRWVWRRRNGGRCRSPVSER